MQIAFGFFLLLLFFLMFEIKIEQKKQINKRKFKLLLNFTMHTIKTAKKLK
jgi:hypothetical protein